MWLPHRTISLRPKTFRNWPSASCFVASPVTKKQQFASIVVNRNRNPVFLLQAGIKASTFAMLNYLVKTGKSPYINFLVLENEHLSLSQCPFSWSDYLDTGSTHLCCDIPQFIMSAVGNIHHRGRGHQLISTTKDGNRKFRVGVRNKTKTKSHTTFSKAKYAAAK